MAEKKETQRELNSQYKREIAKYNIAIAQHNLEQFTQNKRKYEAASLGRRTDGWISNKSSGQVEAGIGVHRLRERARQLVRDNAYAKRAIDIITNNVIGDGITATPLKENSRLMKLWQEWALTTDIDFYGKHNFYGLQKIVAKSATESGECLVRVRRNKNLAIPFQLQVLEGDYIDDERHNNGSWGGGMNEHFGIKFDDEGRVISYFLWTRHPGDNVFVRQSNEIPADEIFHIFEELRPGQTRGVPDGVSAMTTLYNLDGYLDAEIERKKAAACFVAFITNGTTPINRTKPLNELDRERLTPGLIQYLNPNESVTFGNPPNPDDSDFKKFSIHTVAAGYGISYESLSGDLSNTSFSSGRMGWIEMSRNMKAKQDNVFIPQFCDKTWKLFTSIANMKYGIESVGVQWTVPKRVMIDPAKEIKALNEEVRAGLKTLPEALRECGYNPDASIVEQAAFLEKAKKLGLILDSNPANDWQRIPKPTQGSTIKPPPVKKVKKKVSKA